MDRRPLPNYGRLPLLLTLLATLAATGGCASALATALWVVQGPNVDAECDVLRGKRVAVVCRPMANLTYQGVAKDIAKQMNTLLGKHVPKIDVIDHREVAEWIDENTWDEYTEIGEALEADMVVGVDLEHFGIFEGMTIYQGKANVTVKVYDCSTGEVVFEKTLPQVIWPPNSVVSASDQQEAEFRRNFVGVLADEIARHFYAHDPRAYFAMDATTLR